MMVIDHYESIGFVKKDHKKKKWPSLFEPCEWKMKPHPENK